MKKFSSEELRSVAVMGHGQTGKTSLVSAILYNTKMVNRLGTVDEGNTVTDYREEEVEKKISVTSALAFAVKDNKKINIIDTPGYPSFIWESRLSLRAVETGMILVCAQEGVEVQTEKVFEYARDLGKPVFFVVNKMKRDLADFHKTLEAIQESFGKNAVALQLPIGKGDSFEGVVDLLTHKAYKFKDGERDPYETVDIPADLQEQARTMRETLIEKIAENDEAIMEKYFEDGDLGEEEIRKGLLLGMKSRDIYPVLLSDGGANQGVQLITDFILKYTPSPLDIGEEKTVDGTVKIAPGEPFRGFVFKTLSDPFTGRINIMKVVSGTFKADGQYFNSSKGREERVGGIFGLQGKTQDGVEEVEAGDIVAMAKLKETQTGDSLTVKGDKTRFKPVEFPIPSISFAIEPKSREDENKIATALTRIQEEDPTVQSRRDSQTKELLISGNGQFHVEMIVGILKHKYHVDVEMRPPRIPYQETIKKGVDVEKKYKKQSGGRGQYAHIFIKVEPLPRGEDFKFEQTIFGGSIPKNYHPAVEKGVRQAKEKGILAGYPVVDFKVNLYDGGFHEVDSSDMAFQICASQAFKEAMKQARATLLEPIMKVEVVAPEENLGDINSALSGKRGRIQGMEPKGKYQVVKALVPMAEMLDFEPNLTSITGGRGSYTMEFSHYDELPGNLQQKVIEQAKQEGRIRGDEEE